MKIEYVIGDATDPQSKHKEIKIILHCCNNIGAWGAGFVIPLAKRYPQARDRYLAWYEKATIEGISNVGELPLGAIQMVWVAPSLQVCNLIGQHGTGYNVTTERSPIRYDAIDRGLVKLRKEAESLVRFTGSPVSIHCPRFGAGLAGGDWRVIEALLYVNLADFDIPVTVYDLSQNFGGA